MDQWKAYQAFQKDADIVRLQHLKYYGELLLEFKEKTGNYPFMDEATVPLYVHVASPEQEMFAKMRPPYKHKMKSFKEFVQVVEMKLGRQIDEHYDPQYRPDYKPNFYIYMANRGTYFFAIHQHQEYSFAKKVSKHYNKIEISNHPNSGNMANDPKMLFASKEFLTAMSQPILKLGFFKEREKKFIHATKQ